jgi:hypothetical protein
MWNSVVRYGSSTDTQRYKYGVRRIYHQKLRINLDLLRYKHGLGRWLQIACPSPLWVRIPTGTSDSFMWGSYPASLRNVGGSTQVPVRAWNNAREGTWGLPPPVKLERSDMTYTVSMWRKIQNKKKKKKKARVSTNKYGLIRRRTNWYGEERVATDLYGPILSIHNLLHAHFQNVPSPKKRTPRKRIAEFYDFDEKDSTSSRPTPETY